MKVVCPSQIQELLHNVQIPCWCLIWTRTNPFKQISFDLGRDSERSKGLAEEGTPCQQSTNGRCPWRHIEPSSRCLGGSLGSLSIEASSFAQSLCTCITLSAVQHVIKGIDERDRHKSPHRTVSIGPNCTRKRWAALYGETEIYSITQCWIREVC